MDKYVFSSSPAGDSPKVLSPQKAGKDSKPSSNFNTSSYVWPLTAAERVSDKIRIKVWNLLNKEILLLVEDAVQNVYNNAGQIRPYDEEYVMIKAGDMLCISMTATPTMIYDKITPDPNEVRVCSYHSYQF